MLLHAKELVRCWHTESVHSPLRWVSMGCSGNPQVAGQECPGHSAGPVSCSVGKFGNGKR